MKKIILLLLLLPALNARTQPNLPAFPGHQIEKNITLPNGIRLHYISRGIPRGIPVIFLHGFTDSWISFKQILTKLPSDIYAIAVSQRGHGRSSAPKQGYHPTDFSQDLFLMMEKLDIPQAIIVGHSMGGVIAQQFMLDHPDKVAGIVLLGALASATSNEGVQALINEVNAFKINPDREYIDAFQRSTISVPINEKYLNELINESALLSLNVWKDCLNGLANTDLCDKFKTINKPVLIIWGDGDKITDRNDQEKFLQIPKSKMIIYKGHGHAVHWEAPDRIVNDLMNFIGEINLVNIPEISLPAFISRK